MIDELDPFYLHIFARKRFREDGLPARSVHDECWAIWQKAGRTRMQFDAAYGEVAWQFEEIEADVLRARRIAIGVKHLNIRRRLKPAYDAWKWPDEKQRRSRIDWRMVLGDMYKATDARSREKQMTMRAMHDAGIPLRIIGRRFGVSAKDVASRIRARIIAVPVLRPPKSITLRVRQPKQQKLDVPFVIDVVSSVQRDWIRL